MSIIDRFAQLVWMFTPGRRRESRMTEDDEARFVSESELRRWGDVVYYGPGAQAANERRAARLGRMKRTPAPDTPEAKTPERARSSHKRRKVDGRSLRARLERLRQAKDGHGDEG